MTFLRAYNVVIVTHIPINCSLAYTQYFFSLEASDANDCIIGNTKVLTGKEKHCLDINFPSIGNSPL